MLSTQGTVEYVSTVVNNPKKGDNTPPIKIDEKVFVDGSELPEQLFLDISLLSQRIPMALRHLLQCVEKAKLIEKSRIRSLFSSRLPFPDFTWKLLLKCPLSPLSCIRRQVKRGGD